MLRETTSSSSAPHAFVKDPALSQCRLGGVFASALAPEKQKRGGGRILGMLPRRLVWFIFFLG